MFKNPPQWEAYCSCPTDHRNISILQTMDSGIPLCLEPLQQNAGSLCLCGLWAPCYKGFSLRDGLKQTLVDPNEPWQSSMSIHGEPIFLGPPRLMEKRSRAQPLCHCCTALAANSPRPSAPTCPAHGGWIPVDPRPAVYLPTWLIGGRLRADMRYA